MLTSQLTRHSKTWLTKISSRLENGRQYFIKYVCKGWFLGLPLNFNRYVLFGMTIIR